VGSGSCLSSQWPGEMGGVIGPWPIMACDSRKKGTSTELPVASPGAANEVEREDCVTELCILSQHQDMKD
jgi:hypothetical protein